MDPENLFGKRKKLITFLQDWIEKGENNDLNIVG